ncbi:MAG: peptidase M16 [Caulobacterales bacterium 68-7]|mgnify:CR=1 FL=1|nr:MAG: peptidase M16 [Caulobacterales bacterium 68-7]
MIRFSRLALAATASLALAGCSLADRLPKVSMPHFGGDKTAAEAPRPAPAPAPAAPAASARAPETGWPQATSDVAPDPSVRFGTLPNGMRYALMKNATPPGQASFRLRFDAGSLMEADDQQGLAHFLEHMAFNGSKTVPEGDMVKILERLGLAFGADTNASTNFEETIYQLDLPNTKDETVDTSLSLMRDTASELLIDPGAVDRERGVVLSEERTRDSPSYRAYIARFDFMMPGQLPPKRLPIGKVNVLQTAPASRLADFWKAYYRPERAVFVAVGDFDVDAMEAKIKARFADWKAQGPVGAEPALGAVAKRQTEAKVVVEPGVGQALQMSWVSPPRLDRDTEAQRRKDVIEGLGFAVLNRRFQALARSPDAPFISAGGSAGDQFKAQRAATLFATPRPDGWKAALEAMDREQRRIVRFGVRQDELDREIEEYRTAYKAAVAGAATRRTPALANGIVDTLTDREVYTSPAQDQATLEAAVKGLKAEEVSAAIKTAFEGSGPLIMVVSPTPVAGAEPAVVAAYTASQAVAVTAPTAPSVTAWPYADFGTPGKVVETKDVTDLDAVMMRFQNGVRLTVKPTRFRDDQILVQVRIGDGRLSLPKDRQSTTWASSAFVEGGLKQISSEDYERVLANRNASINFGVDDDAFTLGGRTRPEDLDIQMQLLAAYATEPGWREAPFARVKTYGSTLHDQYEATDGGVVQRDIQGLLRGGDKRWTFPSRGDIANATLAAMRADIDPGLSKGAIEITVVGDTTVEKATAAVAATFGALPARPGTPPPPASARQVAFPAATPSPVILTHKGRDDQAMAYAAWPTTDFFADMTLARNTSVLADVMGNRLLEEIREKQGATYSPSVGAMTSNMVWPGWGYIAASVEVPPDKIDGFFKDVASIAADLRAKPPTDDEMQRAKKPKLDGLMRQRETNEYWISTLSGAQADPRKLDAVRSVVAGIERVTPADVQAAAQRYLVDSKEWKLVARPGK